MDGKHGQRRSLTDFTMWFHIVVVAAPKFDLRFSVVKAQEPVLVQAFQRDTSIKAFDEGVVRWFS